MATREHSTTAPETATAQPFNIKIGRRALFAGAFAAPLIAAAPLASAAENLAAGPHDAIAEMAAVFHSVEMTTLDKDHCPIPSNEEFVSVESGLMFTLHGAWAIMTKSKPELMETAKGLMETSDEDTDGLKYMVDMFGDIRQRLLAYADMIESAETRIMTAGAAVFMEAERESAKSAGSI
jgi:hypothetical protein